MQLTSLQNASRSTRKSGMASNDVREDMGYKPVSDLPRPVIDQGMYDYMVIWPRRMDFRTGLAKAREQLNRMEERDARKASGSDTAQRPTRADAA